MGRDGEIRTLPKAALHVGYRHCDELQEGLALGALLRPPGQQAAEAIRAQIETYRRRRHETQPREPSAGCIFKNPEGESAGPPDRGKRPEGRAGRGRGGLPGPRELHHQPRARHQRGGPRTDPAGAGAGAARARDRTGARGAALRPDLEGGPVSGPVVAVLAGGTSAEREVSLGSGQACAAALSPVLSDAAVPGRPRRAPRRAGPAAGTSSFRPCTGLSARTAGCSACSRRRESPTRAATRPPAP